MRDTISLCPSLTDLALSLGAGKRLAAVTRYCPAVPGAIRAGGVRDPDLPTLLAVRPRQALLGKDENRRADAEALAAAGVSLVVTRPRDVPSTLVMMQQVAEALDADATPLQARLRTELSPLRDTLAGQRLAVVVWRKPWIIGGRDTFVGGYLRWLGAETLPGGWRAASSEELASVDALLLPDEPCNFTAPEAQSLAVELGVRCMWLPGRELCWPGQRIAAGLARVVTALSDGVAPRSRKSP